MIEDLLEQLCQNANWKTVESSPRLYSTMKFYRNIRSLPFPLKMTLQQKREVLEKGKEAFKSNPFLSHPRFIEGERLTPAEKEYIQEHFWVIESFQRINVGEAIVVDDVADFLAILNIQNHLQLKVCTPHNLYTAFDRLQNIEVALGESLPYAFSSPFGFLTSNPYYCGTACKAVIYFHLPALVQTKQWDTVFRRICPPFLSYTSLQGQKKDLTGNVVLLYNKLTLGLSEIKIIHALEKVAHQLILEEKLAKESLKKSPEEGIRDAIHRASGILLHARRIDAIEALNYLSLCKLGQELGWISGLDEKAFATYLIRIQKGQIAYHSTEKPLSSSFDIEKARILFIQQHLHPSYCEKK